MDAVTERIVGNEQFPRSSGTVLCSRTSLFCLHTYLLIIYPSGYIKANKIYLKNDPLVWFILVSLLV